MGPRREGRAQSQVADASGGTDHPTRPQTCLTLITSPARPEAILDVFCLRSLRSELGPRLSVRRRARGVRQPRSRSAGELEAMILPDQPRGGRPERFAVDYQRPPSLRKALSPF